MGIPLGMTLWAQILSASDPGQFRTVGVFDTGGFYGNAGVFLATPQQKAPLPTGFGKSFRPNLSQTTSLNVDEFIVVGNQSVHGYKPGSGNYGSNPYFVKCTDFDDDALYILQILALDYFNPDKFNNTPASTTDRYALTKQIYDAGMWIWRNGNLPPVNMDCRVNIEMELNECYGENAGPNISSIGSANLQSYSMARTNPRVFAGYGGTYTVPYIGTWNPTKIIPSPSGGDASNGAECSNSSNIGISSLSTQEWIARVPFEGASYATTDRSTIARVGSNYLLLNWTSTQSVFFLGGRIGNGVTYSIADTRKLHHGLVTANGTSGDGKLYFGDTTDNWGLKKSVTNITNTQSKINTDDQMIGGFATSIAVYDMTGQIGCYRVWDGEMTQAQAEICWLHNRWRIVDFTATFP